MIMKRIASLLGIVLASALAGCSTTPVVLGPVGPNPTGPQTRAKRGQLEVFSAMTGVAEGNNPTWYQHSDYEICRPRGEVLKYVMNSPGHYSSGPRLISLPPGEYVVKAEAKDCASVEVPVVIKPGQVTKVHLDDAWRPSALRKTALVRLPTGNPVGWSAIAD